MKNGQLQCWSETLSARAVPLTRLPVRHLPAPKDFRSDPPVSKAAAKPFLQCSEEGP